MDNLQSKLKDFFGYTSFKGEQEKIIRHLISGRDAFVVMPTGGGKSLCYQLPALVMEGTAVVISPLIALMKNQVDAIRGFVAGSEGIAHFLNSSLNKAQITQVRKDLTEGMTKLLYVAPESLNREENIALLKEIKISFYAIDEAHCISEWGHDFRPEYRRIKSIIKEIGNAPIIALTATATPKVQADIIKNLGIDDTADIFKSSFNRENLYYELRDKVGQNRDIIRFIKQHPGKSGIIYCLSRKTVEELSELLNINKIRALPYHAGLDAKQRTENQDKFLTEEVDVIVATIAFGMGIDKPDIRFVIHYDIPKSLEGYYQETGRAGRDGGEGICICYYSQKDILKLEKFMQSKPVIEQEIGKQLLAETSQYARTNQCRRKILLNYFGEEYKEDNCHNCDNCLYPKKGFDGQKEMLLAIRLIKELPESFKAGHLANILAGNTNAMIRSYNHDKLPLFGAGKEHKNSFWNTVVYQGIVLGFFSKEVDKFGLIHLTDKGEGFYQKPYEITIIEDRQFSNGEKDEDIDFNEGSLVNAKDGVGTAIFDPTLFSMLKDLRRQLSKKLQLQPWIIFSDASLEDMSINYPITFEELRNCQGIGEGKARKYGEKFIELIAKYVEENEILRPMDFVVRSSPNKSANKISIIQNIDKKIPLEDIARGQKLDMRELIEEIETIVSTGTKLDINYDIEQNIDEETIEEVFDYFRDEAESDSIEDAISTFGNDVDEFEIRLIRIKFLSEVVN